MSTTAYSTTNANENYTLGHAYKASMGEAIDETISPSVEERDML